MAEFRAQAPWRSQLDRINGHAKDDWDGPRRRLGGQCRIGCPGDDHRHLSEYQISGKRRQPLGMAIRRVVLYRYVAAF